MPHPYLVQPPTAELGVGSEVLSYTGTLLEDRYVDVGLRGNDLDRTDVLDRDYFGADVLLVLIPSYAILLIHDPVEAIDCVERKDSISEDIGARRSPLTALCHLRPGP